MRILPTPRARGLRTVLLLALAGAFASPQGARAQVLPATAGALGGFAVGTYTMIGVYVAEARAGKYLYALEDVFTPRLEIIPWIAGPVVGAALGWSDADRLAGAGLWGGVGLVAGTAVGIPLGRAIWGSPEGRWAGGIILGAAGMVTGIVIGATREGGDGAEDGGGGPGIPIGWTVRVP